MSPENSRSQPLVMSALLWRVERMGSREPPIAPLWRLGETRWLCFPAALTGYNRPATAISSNESLMLASLSVSCRGFRDDETSVLGSLSNYGRVVVCDRCRGGCCALGIADSGAPCSGTRAGRGCRAWSSDGRNERGAHRLLREETATLVANSSGLVRLLEHEPDDPTSPARRGASPRRNHSCVIRSMRLSEWPSRLGRRGRPALSSRGGRRHS